MTHDRRVLISATVWGTLEVFVIPQLTAFRADGWRVLLVASDVPKQSKLHQKHANFRSLEMSRGIDVTADARALKDWLRLLRAAKPDVIIGSTPKAGLLSMVAGRILGIENRVFLHRGSVWETETGRRRRIVKAMEKLTCSSATHVLSVSPSLAQLVVEHGVHDAKPRVLGKGGSKGVDLDRFHITSSSQSNKAPVMGFIGRFNPDKRLDVVLAAYEAARSVNPKVKLRLAGTIDASNPVSDQLRYRLNNTPGIEQLGQIDDTPSFYNSIDVLVFPSMREGLPNVVIEAAACGVPTVGWDVTGVKDAIHDGVSGALVPLNDIEQFCAATNQLLFHPQPDVEEQCREWATNFDQELLTRELLNFLDEICPPR